MIKNLNLNLINKFKILLKYYYNNAKYRYIKKLFK